MCACEHTRAFVCICMCVCVCVCGGMREAELLLLLLIFEMFHLCECISMLQGYICQCLCVWNCSFMSVTWIVLSIIWTIPVQASLYIE